MRTTSNLLSQCMELYEILDNFIKIAHTSPLSLFLSLPSCKLEYALFLRFVWWYYCCCCCCFIITLSFLVTRYISIASNIRDQNSVRLQSDACFCFDAFWLTTFDNFWISWKVSTMTMTRHDIDNETFFVFITNEADWIHNLG